MIRRISSAAICYAFLLTHLPGAVRSQERERVQPSRAIVTVNYSPGHPANRIIPSQALGAGVDGSAKGNLDLQLTPQNVKVMRSAGLQSLTYRLRTELANEVWHWNPKGSWSDPANQEGYWVSDATLGQPISLSHGYRLPRRGNTIDQANDDGYSRIDDGDSETFWKSNPYLDEEFTHEPNSLHPQWVVIEFSKPERINALRVLWGKPFPVTFRIQYADIDDVSDIALNVPGMWRDCPHSVFVGGGDYSPKSKGHLLGLSKEPITTRWLRILMTDSSRTSTASTNDVRDRIGFAMRELSAGYQDGKWKFHDVMHHASNRKRQTIIHVSSTDPWHRATDLDEDVEQVGLDRIYSTGLTNNLPMLVPTGLLFDTPENAADEIRYLRERGYKFDAAELGEEPDGQYVSPEDYGALYSQWADAIRRVDKEVKLGGPSFQEIMFDREDRGNAEWMRRFLDYLKQRKRLSDFEFFSFEWYPFDNVCDPIPPQLMRAPRLMESALRAMQRNGLSRQRPWVISEYGYSAFASRAEIDLEGALLNADIIGKFFTLGGSQAFLFGYPPGYAGRDYPCTAGGNMMFSLNDEGKVGDRFATYFGTRLLTQQWLASGEAVHEIYPAHSDAKNELGEELITAYAAKTDDGTWSLLLINKDPARTFEIEPVFKNASSIQRFKGMVDVYQFSSEQYALNDSKQNPRPIRAADPAHRTIEANQSLKLDLPAYSLTVVRGQVGNLK
jgi:hypothetical protein